MEHDHRLQRRPIDTAMAAKPVRERPTSMGLRTDVQFFELQSQISLFYFSRPLSRNLIYLPGILHKAHLPIQQRRPDLNQRHQLQHKLLQYHNIRQDVTQTRFSLLCVLLFALP